MNGLDYNNHRLQIEISYDQSQCLDLNFKFLHVYKLIEILRVDILW